jgi:NAD kinase
MKIAIGFMLALCTKAGDAMYSKSAKGSTVRKQVPAAIIHNPSSIFFSSL